MKAEVIDYKGEERRRYPRVPRIFLALCKDTVGTVVTQLDFVYGYGKNISKGGIFFESEKGFSVGTILELSLYASTLPEAITVKGRVVWTRPAEEKGLYHYGVSFCEVTSPDILLIEQLMWEEVYAASGC